jgi:hypothetical protein
MLLIVVMFVCRKREMQKSEKGFTGPEFNDLPGKGEYPYSGMQLAGHSFNFELYPKRSGLGKLARRGCGCQQGEKRS